MTHASGYLEVERRFRASEYGETLAGNARYDRYRHPSIGLDQWVELLGRDVSNLEHLSLTRGIALGFVRHSERYQPDLLTHEEGLTLILAASLHDWGEAITGDIPYGLKTKEHDIEEVLRLRQIAEALYPDGLPPFFEEALAIVFDHEGETKLGKIFFAIENIGYMHTGLNAMELSAQDRCPAEQVAGLQWLYTDVTANSLPKAIRYAEDYDAMRTLLVAHSGRIDTTLTLVGSHISTALAPEPSENDVFDNYNAATKPKMIGKSIEARAMWEEFKYANRPLAA